ncbi:MAG: glycosyltransferase [Nanoarchaeota archaeon]
MEKLALIVPAYNEEKRIEKMLLAYSSYFESLKKKKVIDYNILVVINNTQDKTEEKVKLIEKKNHNISHFVLKEKGKGNAIIQGFNRALKSNSSLIGFVDADLATTPESFYDLILNIKDTDGTIANRHHPFSKIFSKGNYLRKILSKILNILVFILFSFRYSDTQCGAKLFTRSAIEKLIPKLSEKGWIIDIDLLYQSKLLNLNIQEVPTIWYEVKGSKLNPLIDSINMLLDIIKYRLKLK